MCATVRNQILKKWKEKTKNKKRICSEVSVNSLGNPWSQPWNNYIPVRHSLIQVCLRFCSFAIMLHVITLILSASSGERLCKGTVSVRLSVCLSVPSIDSQLAAATCSWLAALQLGRGRQVSINSCRCRVSAVNRYIPPAPKSTAGSANAVIRGGSTRTCCCCFTQTRSTDNKEISLKARYVCVL